MKSIHISLTEFLNESRVLKEANTLVSNQVFNEIFIAALNDERLSGEISYNDKIRLKRFSLITRKFPKSFLMQALKYLEFCIRVSFFYRNEDIKVINVHSLSLLPLGLLLKNIYRAKLVYDTHELETEVNGVKGFRKSVNKKLERLIIKYVDMTLVVSESIADWYVNEYKIKRPPVILNVPKFRNLKANDHFREQLNITEDQIIVLYQGCLSPGRGINLIMEAFMTRNDNQLVIVFMGYGQLEADIKCKAKEYENIYFFPAVPPHVVLEYTSSADIGISLIENTCLSYYYCMPNKMFEYAMVGLPVLVSSMKDMSEFVTKNNMGSVIREFTPGGINKALDEFLQKDLTEMKENAYKAACENAWEFQEKKMLTAYANLLTKIDG